ncbi:hypothetical protein [Naasia aerilata]|nr:hypothetical protein [Naasia aerilata]
MTTSLLSARHVTGLTIAAVAILLSGCAPALPASPGATASQAPADPAEVPAESVGDSAGDDIPSGMAVYWLTSLDGSEDYLRAALGEWAAKDCTVDAAIDGEYLCYGALNSAVAVGQTIAELFESVGDQGLDTAQLDALAPAGRAAADAADAALEWNDQECNWEATDACAPLAQDAYDTASALLAALEDRVA